MNYKTIKLTQGYETKVDSEDYEWLSKNKWRYQKSGGYAVRTKRIGSKCKTLCMHRVILEYHGTNMAKLKTDHENRDGLDNQKANLRVATHAQNMRNRKRQKNNTSGYIGVCLAPNGKRQAAIKVNGVTNYLGQHNDIEEAAKAYDCAALKYHREFARINFSMESQVRKRRQNEQKD